MTGRQPDSPDRARPQDPNSQEGGPDTSKQTPSGQGAASRGAVKFGGSGTLHPAKIENAEQRRQRLAAQLRANLSKRKAQARARAQADVAQTEAGDDTGPLET